LLVELAIKENEQATKDIVMDYDWTLIMPTHFKLHFFLDDAIINCKSINKKR